MIGEIQFSLWSEFNAFWCTPGDPYIIHWHDTRLVYKDKEGNIKMDDPRPYKVKT